MNSQPNILIFMTDQQRGDTVATDSPVLTPNIDKFRREGVTFTDSFCTAPHCCPSRASFLTGLYPSEHGVWNNVNVANTLSTGLNAGVSLFSEDLLSAGYELFFSGKWHISNEERPCDRGWQEGYVSGLPVDEDERALRWRQYKEIAQNSTDDPSRPSEPGRFRRSGYGEYMLYAQSEHPFDDEKVVDSARGFLENRDRDGKPWLLFVGPKGPHDPYAVPQRFLDLYDPESILLPASLDDEMLDKPGLYRRMRRVFASISREEQREALRHYYAFCSYEDYLFGQLLESLEQSGRKEDTLVLYLSDHGDYAGEHGLWCKGLPAFDSAYRIPSIVRWPRGIHRPGRTVSRSISLVDFAPTFLEVSGLSQPGDAHRFSGRSLLPFLKNKPPAEWDDTNYFMTNGNELYGIQRIVRTGKWKYVYNGFDFDELYNLKADPEELRNLIEDPRVADVVEKLSTAMWSFGLQHGERSINPYIATALAPHGPAAALK